MNLQSKNIPLIILAITALICSRVMFALFDDPEGPNLLVVTVMAAILYFPSLKVHKLKQSMDGFKRLLLAISTQIVIAAAFYFVLI